MTDQPLFRLKISAIPNDEARRAMMRYLLRHIPGTTPQAVEEKLEHLPFYLSRRPMTVSQLKPVVEHLQEANVGFQVVRVQSNDPEVEEFEETGRNQRDMFHSLKKDKKPAVAPNRASPPPPSKSEKGSSARSVVIAQGETPSLGQRLAWRNLSWAGRMRMIGVPLVLILVGIWWLLPGQMIETLVPEPPPAEVQPTVQVRLNAGSVLDKARRRWFALYRTAPDRRFFDAARMLVALPGGTLPKGEVSPFDLDWRLQIEGQKTWTQSAFASFDEHWQQLRALIAESPRGQVERAGDADPLAAVRPVVEMFWAPTQLEAVKLMSELPAEQHGSGPYHALMTDILLNLALQGSDANELIDPLLERALAHAVAAEAAGVSMESIKALMAWFMGYEDSARQRGLTLSDLDPIALLTTGSTDRFQSLALRRDAPMRIRWLALLQQAKRSDSMPALEQAANSLFPNTRYEPAIASLVLNLGVGLEQRGAAADQLIRAMLAEMAQALNLNGSDQAGDLSGAIGDYERLDSALASDDDFMNPQSVARDYWRQGFWNGMSTRAVALRADSRAFGEFVETLKGTSELAVEFANLQRAWTLPTEESMKLVLQNLRQLPWSFQANAVLGSANPSPTGRKLTQDLFERGDSRPANLMLLGLLSQRVLLDQPRATGYFTHALDLAPEQNALLAPKQAWEEGNPMKLKALVADNGQSRAVRLASLQLLQRLKRANAEDGQVLFQALIDASPDETNLYRRAVGFFEEVNDLEAAGQYVARWLEHWPPGSPEHRQALVFKARVLRSSGRAPQAMEIFRQLGNLTDPAFLIEEAQAAFTAGDQKRAFQLALQVYTDNRDIDGLLLNVELLWRVGALDTAAELIMKHGPGVDRAVWRERLAPLFVRSFKDNDALASQCIETLQRYRFLPFNLAQFTLGIRAAGGPAQLALAFIDGVPTDSPGGLDVVMQGFEMHQQAQGFEPALEWLQQRLADVDLNLLPNLFYAADQGTLLWRFFPEPEKLTDASSLWLLRAAAMVREGDDQHPKLDEITDHFSHAGTDLTTLIGRFLVGLDDEETVIASGRGEDSAGRIAYYLGIKAAADKRFSDANGWMQVVRELRRTDQPEYVWSEQWLRSRMSNG